MKTKLADVPILTDYEIKCSKITSEDRKWCNIHRVVYLLNKRSKSRKNKEEL